MIWSHLCNSWWSEVWKWSCCCDISWKQWTSLFRNKQLDGTSIYIVKELLLSYSTDSACRVAIAIHWSTASDFSTVSQNLVKDLTSHASDHDQQSKWHKIVKLWSAIAIAYSTHLWPCHTLLPTYNVHILYIVWILASYPSSIVTSAAVIIAAVAARKLWRRRQRSCWVRSWMLCRRQLGTYGALVRDLRSNDEMAYRNFCRMDADSYQELLTLVTPAMSKKDTILQKAITADERLCMTLRFLAAG